MPTKNNSPKTAKDAFKAMDGKKIPKVKELNAEYGELLRKKSALRGI